MEYDDAQRRIADLERQLAEQKRIAELERQLAETNSATYGQPRAPVFRPRMRTGGGDRLRGMDLVGAIAGIGGVVAGGGAALTASFPSSALWTSALVCGKPGALMIDTSHYSYRPGQSGTSVGFQCVDAGGGRDAGFLAISVLQSVLVAIVVAGVAAVVLLLRRRRRNESVGPGRVVTAAALGALALAVVVGVTVLAVANSSAPVQMSPGGTLTIDGNGETKSVACNGGTLTVDGREETVTVSGHCRKLSVDGVIHHITIDSADVIYVDGIHNVVTYHSGDPQITNDGGLNTIQRG
jgi:hypothetical protein